MKPLSKILFGLFGAAVIAGGIFGFFRLEGTPPVLEIRDLPDALGASRDIVVEASDPGSGLRRIRIAVTTDEGERVLEERSFPSANFFAGGRVRRETLTVALDPKALRLPDGDIQFRVTARDFAWRRWWNGNVSEIERTVRIDTQPPRIEVLTDQHNIAPGGSALVVYRLSEPCDHSGVRVGENFFPGHPADAVLGKNPPHLYLCFFALDYRQGRETPIALEAMDAAGNIGRAGFYHHIRARNFPSDDLRISEGFLQQILPTFQSDLDRMEPAVPESPVERFLAVNRELRRRDVAVLRSATRNTDAALHWSGAFVRLPNAARRAGFADHRRYLHEGEEIDRQVHLGIDLASVARAPVPAANAGRVVLVADVGIYGGTVMIDHGFGLFSQYSHLSRFTTEEGRMVEKGDVVGHTGLTGLAGGDHLHLGMMVHDTFVDPVEWWDGQWIRNNVLNKIEAVRARP